MIKKTLDKLKQFFKENIKDIIILFVLYSIFMYPLDYYIITGGGIMKIEDRIVIENEYKSKGSFNLAYVAEIKGTVATYLLSYLMPNWEREKLSDYTYNDIETLKRVIALGYKVQEIPTKSADGAKDGNGDQVGEQR